MCRCRAQVFCFNRVQKADNQKKKKFFYSKTRSQPEILGECGSHPPLILVSCCVSLFKIPQSPFYIYINENSNMCVYVQRVVHISHTEFLPSFTLSHIEIINSPSILIYEAPIIHTFIICIQFNVSAAPPFKGWDPTVSGTLLS